MSLCWKFSQISGIVQNVSMLIMVVMRIVAAVGEEKGSERVSLEPGALPGPDLLHKMQVFCSIARQFTRKILLLSALHLLPCLHFLPVLGCFLFAADRKKVPFDFPSSCVSCKCVTAARTKVSHMEALFDFPSLPGATISVRPHRHRLAPCRHSKRLSLATK